jgi:hypothetical protein
LQNLFVISNINKSWSLVENKKRKKEKAVKVLFDLFDMENHSLNHVTDDEAIIPQTSLAPESPFDSMSCQHVGDIKGNVVAEDSYGSETVSRDAEIETARVIHQTSVQNHPQFTMEEYKNEEDQEGHIAAVIEAILDAILSHVVEQSQSETETETEASQQSETMNTGETMIQTETTQSGTQSEAPPVRVSETEDSSHITPTHSDTNTASADTHITPPLDDSTQQSEAKAEAEVEVPCCRVCHGESEPGHELFYPCKCDGSIKYIHQDCLMLWLKHSKQYDPTNPAFNATQEPPRCELCGEVFRFKHIYKEGAELRLTMIDIVFELIPRILGFIRSLIYKTFLCILWFLLLPLFCAGCVTLISNHLYHGHSLFYLETWLATNYPYLSVFNLYTGSPFVSLSITSLQSLYSWLQVHSLYEIVETLSHWWIAGLSHFCAMLVLSFLLFEIVNFLYKVSQSIHVYVSV